MRTTEEIQKEFELVTELLTENNRLIAEVKNYRINSVNFKYHKLFIEFIEMLQQQNCKWTAIVETLKWVLS